MYQNRLNSKEAPLKSMRSVSFGAFAGAIGLLLISCLSILPAYAVNDENDCPENISNEDKLQKEMDFFEFFGLQMNTLSKMPLPPTTIQKEFHPLWYLLQNKEMKDKKLREKLKLGLNPTTGDFSLTKKGTTRPKDMMDKLRKKVIELAYKAKGEEWDLLHNFLEKDDSLKEALLPLMKNLNDYTIDRSLNFPPPPIFLIDPFLMLDTNPKNRPTQKETQALQQQKLKILEEIFETEISFWEGISALGQTEIRNTTNVNGKELLRLAKVLSDTSLEFIKKFRIILEEFSVIPSDAVNDDLYKIYSSMTWKNYVRITYEYIMLYEDFLKEYGTWTEAHKNLWDVELMAKRFKQFRERPSLKGRYLANVQKTGNFEINSFEDFKKANNILNKKISNHSAMSMVITPVQRLPRHQLLIADLLKKTPAQENGRENLATAESQVIGVIKTINALKKIKDIFTP